MRYRGSARAPPQPRRCPWQRSHRRLVTAVFPVSELPAAVIRASFPCCWPRASPTASLASLYSVALYSLGAVPLLTRSAAAPPLFTVMMLRMPPNGGPTTAIPPHGRWRRAPWGGSQAVAARSAPTMFRAGPRIVPAWPANRPGGRLSPAPWWRVAAGTVAYLNRPFGRGMRHGGNVCDRGKKKTQKMFIFAKSCQIRLSASAGLPIGFPCPRTQLSILHRRHLVASSTTPV